MGHNNPTWNKPQLWISLSLSLSVLPLSPFWYSFLFVHKNFIFTYLCWYLCKILHFFAAEIVLLLFSLWSSSSSIHLSLSLSLALSLSLWCCCCCCCCCTIVWICYSQDALYRTRINKPTSTCSSRQQLCHFTAHKKFKLNKNLINSLSSFLFLCLSVSISLSLSLSVSIAYIRLLFLQFSSALIEFDFPSAGNIERIKKSQFLLVGSLHLYVQMMILNWVVW